MDFQLFTTLITNLLSVNTVMVENPRIQLAAFENNFCFHNALQPMFTVQALSFLLESMQDATMYEITDRLDVSLLFFRFQQQTFLIGPYVRNEYDDIRMQSILAECKIPASYAISLKLYYTSLPLLSTFHVQKEIEACITSFQPATPQYAYRKLHGLFEEIHSTEKYQPDSVDYNIILRRYDYENHFLNMISTGNVSQVQTAFQEMLKTSASSASGSFYTQNVQASMAILRTLVRKAAERSGLSVIVIDEITQRAAQLSASVQSTSELAHYTKTMILELAQAVHDHLTKTGSYSRIVSNVIEYTDLHLSQEILLSRLAEESGVSESSLSRQFKKETGHTFGQYLAKKRCEKAAMLLKGTSLQIQEISGHVGYPDNNYFVKVFKRLYGVTPSEYRKG